MHGLLTKLRVWYYIVFPSRGCWKVFFYGTIKTSMLHISDICEIGGYAEVVVLDHVEIFFSHLDGEKISN